MRRVFAKFTSLNSRIAFKLQEKLHCVTWPLAITSAESFSSLGKILSCPVALVVFIAYSSLETSASVTN